MTIMITGSSGFIGTNFLNYWAEKSSEMIIGLDKQCPFKSLEPNKNSQHLRNYIFHQLNIHNQKEVSDLLMHYKPRRIIHLAAETHVDRSIRSPKFFIDNNITATFIFLQCVTNHWQLLPLSKREKFLFLHVSTDEVFGGLTPHDIAAQENSPYRPKNPYAATKASSDHLVRTWHHTFQFPSIITHCTNNYGPFQKPEKLIPKVILKALNEEPIPLYGSGLQSRDWLYVNDHCRALHLILEQGSPGETYNIGANNEIKNINIVKQICNRLDQKKIRKNSKPYENLIQLIQDRPGHDFRYALNTNKIKTNLKWIPKYHFENALNKTIDWYISNENWLTYHEKYAT